MESKKQVKLLVVDDHEPYCDLIRECADMWHYAYDLECEFASSAEKALQLVHDFCPTVIMLDAHMLDVDCVEFIENHKAANATLIVTSEHPTEGLAEMATSHGAVIYVTKTEDPDELDCTLGKVAWLAANDDPVH